MGWNTLFQNVENIEDLPESSAFKFVEILNKNFIEKPQVKVWDLGCGAGRNSLALGNMGAKVYVSDNSEKAIELTEKRLKDSNIDYIFKKVDMDVYPWEEKEFLEGVFSWAVLQHNTLDNIIKTVDNIYDSLIRGGYFLGSIKSANAESYGKGKKIEENTFVPTSGKEEGIPHHFFTIEEIDKLFPDSKWEKIVLAENTMDYIYKGDRFKELNPFGKTDWNLLFKKI